MTGTRAVVLVADDDQSVRELVADLLQREGHDVLSASDGHEALELARTYPGPLHVVITDIDMPGLEGTVDDMRRSIREIRPRGIQSMTRHIHAAKRDVSPAGAGHPRAKLETLKQPLAARQEGPGAL